MIEKFNLNATALGAAAHAQLERFSGSGWGAAHAFIAVGIIAMPLATFRFMRKGWLLDDQAAHVAVSAYLLPEAVLLDFRTREAKY